MSEVCPYCRGTGRVPARLMTLDELREWCYSNGHLVLPGDLVSTETAAAILGCEPQTLRADRMNAVCIPFVKRARRCYYALAVLDVERR